MSCQATFLRRKLRQWWACRMKRKWAIEELTMMTMRLIDNGERQLALASPEGQNMVAKMFKHLLMQG